MAWRLCINFFWNNPPGGLPTRWAVWYSISVRSRSTHFYGWLLRGSEPHKGRVRFAFPNQITGYKFIKNIPPPGFRFSEKPVIIVSVGNTKTIPILLQWTFFTEMPRRIKRHGISVKFFSEKNPPGRLPQHRAIWYNMSVRLKSAHLYGWLLMGSEPCKGRMRFAFPNKKQAVIL